MKKTLSTEDIQKIETLVNGALDLDKTEMERYKSAYMLVGFFKCKMLQDKKEIYLDGKKVFLVEKGNKKITAYHGIVDNNYITCGSEWIGSSNLIVTVVSVDKQRKSVTYEWKEKGTLVQYDKDFFSFQCRYNLIAKIEKL